MRRKAHSKKEVRDHGWSKVEQCRSNCREEALQYAEENGWRVKVGGSHAWGKIYCPYNDKECRCGEFCIASIWSTPRNAGNHARQIRRVVDNCIVHKRENSSGEKEY